MFRRSHWWRFKRACRYWWQRRTRGWDDSETWNLDAEIAGFIVPRLKRFKELNNGYPNGLTPEEWDARIDMMIAGLEDFASGQNVLIATARMRRAQELLGEHLMHLWW
jgi:hypothetical protein